jgi:uncharacterized protein (DUF362 family)
MSKVMIHPASYESMHEALDLAFEIFPLELHGKRVLIKPNLLRASDPREGIVTHPAMLRAVVDKVEAMGPASIVVGDNPGIFCYGANEEAFKKTGLMEAAKGYYQNIGSYSQEVDFNPDFMSTVSVSRIVLDADIINQPAEVQNPRFNRRHRSHQKQLRLLAWCPESQTAQGGRQHPTLP